MEHNTPDRITARSPATEFSWTSRFQNLKLHIEISILDASHANLTSGARDIFIFVKKNSENPPSTFRSICPGACSREVLLYDRESYLRLY